MTLSRTSLAAVLMVKLEARFSGLQMAAAIGLLLLFQGNVALPRGVHGHEAAHDTGATCFQHAEFEQMFTAKTMQPDYQLAAYLAANSISPQYPTFKEIHQKLFHTETSVYADFTPLPTPPFSGGIRPDTIDWLRTKFEGPVRFMVEVGSFVGASATMFGKHLLQPDEGLLLCIDTWDGDINMWLLDNFVDKMARRHGAPALYERFLSRMVSEGLQEKVIPLRTSSTVGARILSVLQYHVDIIYLDSAHEAGETYFELNLYWDLLSPGGVMCGDDYHGFPAVKHDVDLFMRHRHMLATQLDFTADGRTWALVKK